LRFWDFFEGAALQMIEFKDSGQRIGEARQKSKCKMTKQSSKIVPCGLGGFWGQGEMSLWLIKD